MQLGDHSKGQHYCTKGTKELLPVHSRKISSLFLLGFWGQYKESRLLFLRMS